MSPAREPRFDNTAVGKRSLRNPIPHNKRPGGLADMRTLKWRAWRRDTAAWLRSVLKGGNHD